MQNFRNNQNTKYGYYNPFRQSHGLWPCSVAVNILAFGASDSGSNPLRAV